jgi:hypothetical protein
LVDAYEDYNCCGDVSFFVVSKVSKIKFCVKLNKTATEMLKSAYDEECLLRTSVFEWHKRFKEERESLQDDEQTGSPSTSRTEGSTEVIQMCSAEDQTFCVRMTEEGE